MDNQKSKNKVKPIPSSNNIHPSVNHNMISSGSIKIIRSDRTVCPHCKGTGRI